MLPDPPPIVGVADGIAGFAGTEVPEGRPRVVTSPGQAGLASGSAMLERMVRGFFDNGGTRAYIAATLAALESVDEIALLCPLPDDAEEAIRQCERREDRVAILSLPAGLDDVEQVLAARPCGDTSFAASYHPWVRVEGQLTPPGGHVAGVLARHPVGGAPPPDEELLGLDDPPLERCVAPDEAAILTEGGVNPLRDLRSERHGTLLWPSRSLTSDPEWKYVNLRRLFIYLEQSIDEGTQWAVFEPNGEDLWRRARTVIAAFLGAQWEEGRLVGRTVEEAFFVRCDRTTMTEDDLRAGRLVCAIGVALVRPAEFVVFRIGQWTADRCP